MSVLERGAEAGPLHGSAARRSPIEGLPVPATVEASGPPMQVQRLANHAGPDDVGVHEAARRGTSGSSEALPHVTRIQSLFGRHDVSGVKAHSDVSAQAGARAMGAQAFAVGDRVAFDGPPSLHTAAHEAAHVVQQRAGVQLKGGVGAAGDPHEQHADAVADRVEKGESAVDLLDHVAAGGGGGGTVAVQRAPALMSPGHDPEAGSVRKARAQAALKSVVDRAATLTGGGAANGYDLKGKQKNEPKEYQNWQAWGVGAGNRAGDVPDKDGKVKNASQGGVKPAQVNLSDLKFDTTNAGDGVYHEHGADAKGWSDKRKDKLSYDGTQPSVDIWGGSATAGARQKLGARVNADAKGDLGNANAGADADLVAEAGANVNAKLNSDGFTAGAAASAKAGAEASAKASYQTPGLAIEGVDKPLTAGVEANASVFAGVKAGIEGKAAISKDFVGVKGSAGAFAGIEGSLEGKASVGPVSSTVGISGMAGAGIGADGSIAYEDGHLRIGGRLYAALGLGGSVSASVDLDLKQAVQLGLVTAKQAHDLADADHDGCITLNDGATHAAHAMTGTATAIDSGVDATLHTLDANHDGKIDGKDATYAAGHAWDTTKQGAGAAWDATKQGAGAAWDATKQGATVAWDATKQTLDRNHDGKIDGADVAAGASQAGHTIAHGAKVVGDLAEKGANKVKGALDHDGDGKVELSDITAHLGDAGNAVLNAGQHAMASVTQSAAHVRDLVSDGVKKTAEAVHAAADLNHDGKVDAKDVRKLAQDALDLVENMAQDVKAYATGVVKQAHDAMDLNHDGKVDAKDAAVAKQRVAARVQAMKKTAGETLHSAVEAGHRAVDHVKAEIKLTAKRVFDAADLNHDGKVDAKDAAVARERVVGTAKKVGAAVHDAADLNHDGKVDAKDAVAGAKQASAAVQQGVTFVAKEVADGAKQLYDGAASQVKQAGATLKKGFDDTKQIVAGTWAKVTSYF